MKSDATETAHILTQVERLALAHHEAGSASWQTAATC